METAVPERIQPMRCESCTYLSDGYRCQRVIAKNYSRKIPDPQAFGCARWESYRAPKAKDG